MTQSNVTLTSGVDVEVIRALAIVVVGLAATGDVTAQEAVTQEQETAMQFVGRKLLFSYESGLQVKGHYKSATELHWEALTGPSAGTGGTETINVAEIGPKVYFISWVEKAGTTVSQILDFNTSKVTSFVTYRSGEGRQGMLDKGTFVEQK